MSFWSNKRVWITGASSGIGEATAKLLASKGASLILSSRNKEQLDALIQSLPNPEKHEVIALDVSDATSLRTALNQQKATLESVDVLINNAGISQRSLTWEASAESERQIMETNFFGAVAVAKAALPGMMQRKKGNIVIMSSPAGKFGFPLRSSYSASKHALQGYFESLRAELKDTDIIISFVSPGRVQTNMGINALTKDGTSANAIDERLARGITADECAKVIAKTIESGKAEVYLGREQVLIYLHRYLPWLFRWVVTRVKAN
ncbi:MAG: SDR family NAD(P)-dependent oxidoreductase [Flavobacteriales bacterium]